MQLACSLTLNSLSASAAPRGLARFTKKPPLLHDSISFLFKFLLEVVSWKIPVCPTVKNKQMCLRRPLGEEMAVLLQGRVPAGLLCGSDGAPA